MEFKFSKNFKMKTVEKIIDEIISEIRKEGRLENYGVGIQNMNIKGNGNSCNIKCIVNLCEDSPLPSTIDCEFNIKNDLFQAIPIYEVEGICTYSGFLFKDYGGRIKVLINKISEAYLELNLIWLNISKTVNKTYEVRNKEFIEVSGYKDDESSKEKGSSYAMGKKKDN